MKIKHVYGNVLRIDIPLTIKIINSESGETHEVEEPFYPDTSKPVLVELANQYNITKYTYDATIDGNVAHIEDYGNIRVGVYKVTVKCFDEYNQPYRYMVRDIIEICDATIDAGVEAGIEFDSETYTLEGAVFISYGREQVQADWSENDTRSKAYIKNKPDLSEYATKAELDDVESEIPTLPSHIVTDENYVHTDNNYTNDEKTKLSELENYDDTEIKQEISGKVDKEHGKGLSTNDYTNEDKQRVNGALQSETDPTVPQWAKQSSKPSYTAQEVGALPADTQLFDGDYNSLSNKPDLSGFITASVDNLVNYYLKSETYTKAEVQALIDAVKQFTYEVVQTLPTASADTMYKIYLVPSSDLQAENVKDEYITIENSGSYSWEQIGSTTIDLSGYYTAQQTDNAISQALTTALAGYTTTQELTQLLAAKQDVIRDLAAIRSGAQLGTTAYQKPSTGIPSTDLASAVQTSLGKADSALQSFTETDPTVPSWAKQSSKPTYTAQEVGALPADTPLFSGDYNDLDNKPTIPEIPSNTAYLSSDSGEGIVPDDGIRAVTVTSGATMTISPDVVTVIDGTVGTAAITLQVPQDNLAHVWDILLTTDSSVAITFAMSNSGTILYPNGFSVGASKAIEISVIGVGTKYYLRYGEFA